MYVCMYHTYVQFKLVGNCLDCGEILQSTLYIYFVYIANARHWLLMICDRQDTHSAKHPLGCFYIVNALGHWLLRISVGQARFFAIRRAWGRVWYVGQTTCILPVPIPCLMEHLLIRQEAKYKMKYKRNKINLASPNSMLDGTPVDQTWNVLYIGIVSSKDIRALTCHCFKMFVCPAII